MEIKCLIFHRKAYTKAQKSSLRSFELPSLLPCRWGDALPAAEGPPGAVPLHYFSNNFVVVMVTSHQPLTLTTAPVSVTTLNCLIPAPVPDSDLFSFLFGGSGLSFSLHFPVSSVSTRTTSDPAQTMIFSSSFWPPETPVLASAVILNPVPTTSVSLFLLWPL